MYEIVPSLQAKYDKAETVERCGLILGDGTVLETKNLHHDPEKGFKIPADLMVRFEDDLHGTWHTHPRDIANLSEADYQGFNQWPTLNHYVIGIDGVRCFKVEDRLVIEVKL